MDRSQEMVCFNEDEFDKTHSNNREKSLKEIYELLLVEGKDIPIHSMFSDDYGEQFSLFHVGEAQTKPALTYGDYYTKHENCVWFSYGKKYNRSNEISPLSPKEFFLEKGESIIRCTFFGQNIIAKPVLIKDLWRDSYYPGTYKYVTQYDPIDIFQDLLAQETYKIYIGTSVVKYDNLQPMEVHQIWDQFEANTHFLRNYIYYPIQEISVQDMLNDNFSIKEITKNCISKGENTISAQNIDQIQKIRNNWVYKL